MLRATLVGSSLPIRDAILKAALLVLENRGKFTATILPCHNLTPETERDSVAGFLIAYNFQLNRVIRSVRKREGDTA